jgi:hypothetical protein
MEPFYTLLICLPAAPGDPARRSPHRWRAAWREEFSMRQRGRSNTSSARRYRGEGGTHAVQGLVGTPMS